MIVLDTNVVSEIMRTAPVRRVLDWIDRQDSQTLYLTSIITAELLAGIAVMPTGRRRRGFESMVDRFRDDFEGRILPFDDDAATHYAQVIAAARSKGRPISTPDAQIAGIALAHGFSVASRDARPFETAGVAVIDPWRA